MKYTVYAKLTVGVSYTVEVDDDELGLEGNESPEEIVEALKDRATEIEVYPSAYAGNGSAGGLLGLTGPDSFRRESVAWDLMDCYPVPDSAEPDPT